MPLAPGRPRTGLAWSALGALLAPPLCWSCGGPARGAEPLCRSCRGSLQRLAGEPVWLSFVRVWAPVAYSGPARDLVRALKFRGAIGIADAMAAQITANAPPGWLDHPAGSLDAPTLVPVPLHPRRRRSRGYNQAAAIAEALGSRTSLEMVECLVRTGPPLTQVGRHREERQSGPAGAIEVRAPGGGGRAAGVPERVLLIDDVVTTGATLAACRAALVAARSVQVDAVVFARTLGR